MQKQEYTVEEQEKIVKEILAEEKLDNLETATYGCINFSIFSDGVGISFIVILTLIAAGYLYLKLFKGKIKLPKFFKRSK